MRFSETLEEREGAKYQVGSSLYSQKNKDTGFLGVKRASGESGWEIKEVGHIGVAW